MKTKYILAMLLISSFFAACDKDDDFTENEEETLISIAKADSKLGDFNVGLLAEETLFQGYNKIYLDVKNTDGSPVSQASISLHPLMNMMGMKHAAPAENPVTSPNDDGYFTGAVVFIMPGNAEESWSLGVAIDTGGEKDTVNFSIPEVVSPEEARQINFVSELDGKTYFISLLEPSEPEVGINDIEFTVHSRENMMSFPATENVSLAIEPEMPSMGHGSPNNINPTNVGDGHYKGKVNFTMTGWWRINLECNRDGTPLTSDLSFDVTF